MIKFLSQVAMQTEFITLSSMNDNKTGSSLAWKRPEVMELHVPT